MSERALIIAARDRIRALAAYEDRQVRAEWDERAPATAHDTYIMILPGGVEVDPLQITNGILTGKSYGLDVVVALRAPKKPRDRERDLWIALSSSFEAHMNNVLAQLDGDYTTITNANAQMVTDGTATGTCDTFIEPLNCAGLGPIRAAPAELYAGFPGEATAALVRTIRFRGARRLIST